MALIKMDALPRKRTRYCPHCDEDLTYLVYKKHKEEFYDPFKRVCRCETDFEELDAKDDDMISRAVAVNVGYFNTVYLEFFAACIFHG